MKLNVTERLLILGMQEIPRFGNIVIMRLVTDLLARTAFTEKEIEEWEIVFTGEEGKTSVRWNPSKAQVVEIEITPGMVKLMVESMERADNLSLNIVPLYDRLKALMPEEPKK